MDTNSFKHEIPPELESFDLPPRQPIHIVLGSDGHKTYTWDPGALMNGIMMVTGGSGSGKTEWLRSLIIELVAQGYPTIVFDLHGDIDASIPSFSIDYQGKYGINPLELLSTDPSDGGPLPNINRLLKLFDDAVADGFSPTQLAFLRSILTTAYNIAGITQDDPSSWNNPPPTFDFLRKMLIDGEDVLAPVDHLRLVQDILSTNASTLAAVKNRLLPILEHPAFHAEYVVPVDAMFEKPMRIILKSLQTVDMQFIVADTILRQLFIKSQSLGHVESDRDADKFRMFVIIDEVKILSGNRGDLTNSYHILNRLATEARKYGLGIILASQVIRHFGRDIRSNAASKLVLRPMDVDEARNNAKEMEVSYEELMDLNLPGEGYYRSTLDDDAISMRLFPTDDRPIGTSD